MRFRNVWFELFSFLVALAMAAGSIASVVNLIGNRNVKLPGETIAAVGYLLFAASLFWVSLQAGDMQRQRRELRKRQRAGAKTSAALAEDTPRPAPN